MIYIKMELAKKRQPIVISNQQLSHELILFLRKVYVPWIFIKDKRKF